jgi:hypothetical protein
MRNLLTRSLQYGLYPFLRKSKIHYGPVARITTGFFLSTLAGIGYAVLTYKAYQTSPCGWYGSSDPRCVDNGLVSPISLWWEAIPYALGGFSELFINVPGTFKTMLTCHVLMDTNASVYMQPTVSLILVLQPT